MRKIIILIICLLLTSCSKNIPVFKNVIIENDIPKSRKLSIKMVGDALIHSPIYRDAFDGTSYDFSGIFTEFKDSIAGTDLLYYNQESIIGGDFRKYSGYPRFNTPKEFGEEMMNLGFNLVSRANNHTLDMGETGIINSCNFWNDQKGVLTSGSACTEEEALEPQIMTKNGIRYALLSYTTTTNGLKAKYPYHVNIYDKEKVYEDILKVRDKVDLLMVAMHWGSEYRKLPTESQKDIAKYLSQLGVDIVIGSHPHVIEPIEWIDDTLVIYSLGNFISSQKPVNEYNRLIGLMVGVDLIKTEIKGNTSIKLDNLNTTLLYTYYRNNHNYKVIPFDKVDNTILPNYKNYKLKYESIIKYYDQTVPVS